MKWIRFIFPVILLLSPAPAVFGEIVTLHNGDRLTGQITKESSRFLFLEHEALGSLRIVRDQIKTVTVEGEFAKPYSKKKGDLIWERRVGAGYELAEGNTEYKNWNGDFIINRNRMWIDEWTFKGSGSLRRSHNDLVGQRGQVSLRYAYSITKDLYNFYRISAEHAYFENLKARILPTTGFGYWFFDTDKFKMLAELGAGYQMEFYRPEGSKSEPILHTRFMMSRQINEWLEVGTNTYYFPSLQDFSRYRIEEEAYARFKLSEKFSIRLKAVDQYRSQPRRNAKRNDLYFVSTLEYEF